MSEKGDPDRLRAVTINLGDSEGRIEELHPSETESAMIRISCWSQGESKSQPLDLSENELVTLLQKAIRAGILSPEFLMDLRSEFEI